MNDDKMAKEYNIEGGSVLHLVSKAYQPQTIVVGMTGFGSLPCGLSGGGETRLHVISLSSCVVIFVPSRLQLLSKLCMPGSLNAMLGPF
jgi:hypothetical protein